MDLLKLLDSVGGAQSLGNLRLEIARRTDLMDPGVAAFCWVVDFPLLEYNDDLERWQDCSTATLWRAAESGQSDGYGCLRGYALLRSREA